MGLTIYLFPLAAENSEVLEEQYLEDSLQSSEGDMGYLRATAAGPNEAEFYKEVYAALRARGLPPYREPLRYPHQIDGYWSRQIPFGEISKFYDFVAEAAKLPPLQNHPGNFAPLLNHSLYDGLFVPVDFTTGFKMRSEIYQTEIDIGSSHQLLRDMTALSKYLSLPLDRLNYAMDCNGESFIYFRELEQEFADKNPLWLQNRRIAELCVNLYHAALLSGKFITSVCFG